VQEKVKMDEEKLRTYSKNILLVMFDMDGVIFRGKNFWLELHQAFGTQVQGIASADKYLSSNYDRLVQIVAGNLWKGRPADTYYSLVAKRHYQPGIKHLFKFLGKNNIRSAIISSGPYELALRAKQELGIELIRANRLIVENGHIAGSVDVMVPDSEKKRVGLEAMNILGVEPSRVMYIGDSDSDVELAESVGIAVAYDSHSEKLIAACDIVLDYGQLNKLEEYL
jgi:phosphoserine phosphatase